MNRKELLIMSCLRRNSRAKLTDISRSSRIPVSTIFEKLKRSGPGFITKNTCLVDFSKLGFYARATMVIQASFSLKKELCEFLMKHLNVNSVYKINNGYDFLVEGVFRNMKDLEEFLEVMRERFKVKKQETYFIIEDLKREAFLSDPQSIDLVL